MASAGLGCSPLENNMKPGEFFYMGIEQIEHFVLIMMENRSFDHYLGALNFPPENREDVEGLGVGVLPVNRHAGDPSSDTGVPPWPLDDVRLEFFDPPHEGPEVRQQWNKGQMDGFVSAYENFHTRTLANLPIARQRQPAARNPCPGTSRSPSDGQGGDGVLHPEDSPGAVQACRRVCRVRPLAQLVSRLDPPESHLCHRRPCG